jgi:FMN-dependent NADH-azoreductase
MYNFSVPTVLKAWIDHVARAGRTFRYTASGPVGLLKDKPVFVVTARGGVYTGESAARGLDFQEPYLRAILAFMGLNDVTFIHAEGMAISPEAASNGLQQARVAIMAAVPSALAA